MKYLVRQVLKNNTRAHKTQVCRIVESHRRHLARQPGDGNGAGHLMLAVTPHDGPERVLLGHASLLRREGDRVVLLCLLRRAELQRRRLHHDVHAGGAGDDGGRVRGPRRCARRRGAA